MGPSQPDTQGPARLDSKEHTMGILVAFGLLFTLTMIVHGSRIVKRDF